MRDIAMVALFGLACFWALRRPWISVMVWAWLGLMNPHRLTFGFAYSLPFAQLAAVLVLVLFLQPKNRLGFPQVSTAKWLVAFYGWCCVSSVFSFNEPSMVLEDWIKVTKIQLMLFITLAMMRGRQQVHAMVWLIAISIGFYGIKGGIFTIARGGSSMVMGPTGSFIEGTNHIALAMMMVVPLMYYLIQQTESRWIRLGLWGAMGLNTLAVLGTTSRGALLAVLVMATLLGLKSKRRVATLTVLTIGLILMVIFMPDSWTNKMGTIQSHEDHSAQSRLYTWKMIWNLALHNPFTGGGYSVTANPATWHTYAVTEWAKAYSPHSIYFQALAEHGFVGLGLYLAIGVSTWRLCSRIVKQAVGPELEWANLLARMVQVAVAGFAVGGLFVNLVNFDLPYYFVALAILTHLAVQQQLKEATSRTLPTQNPTSQRPALSRP